MVKLQDLLQEVDAILTSTQESTRRVSVDGGAVHNAGEAHLTQESLERNATQDELLNALQVHFGYTSFRNGQREIIEAILAGENVFAVFPTGYGKSLCYQLPALMFDGITVVISPLISLMKDQVDGLRRRGIDGVGFINSTQTWEAHQHELNRLKRGELQLLYISPERLRRRRFLDILHASSLSLFVIDEAHCISQWGRDFRPAYLSLCDTLDVLQPRRIALFTATAPPDIREDILNLLNIPTPRVFTQGIERPNLKMSVQESEDVPEKYKRLEEILRSVKAFCKEQHKRKKRAETGNGIIYAGRRRETEDVADYLKRRGFRADYYHAGLEPHQRACVQEAFFDNSENGLDIVVATNAFGMGIDKSDIRYIVHWTMTGTLEEYCQEVGRAGRDGKDSHCILLYCKGDKGLHEWFIKENAPDKPSLFKLLKIIEDFKGTERYRTIANDELEWMSGFKDTKIQACLSYLERLEFVKRWYNVPSRLAVQLRPAGQDGLTRTGDGKPGIAERMQTYFAEQLNLGTKALAYKGTIWELCNATQLGPGQVMEQLAELQSQDYIRYWGQEELMLFELIHDSELFSTLTEEQIEVGDYFRRKHRQLDKVVFYALERGCRMRVIRDYFGEEVTPNYQCGTCDLCTARIASA